MGNFMQNRGGYGTTGSGGGGGGATGGPLNNFHNVFGGSGDTTTPALLDPSEFPSLTNARGQNDQSLPQTNPLQPPGSKPYGNFFTSCEFFNELLSFVFLLHYFTTIYTFCFSLCLYFAKKKSFHLHSCLVLRICCFPLPLIFLIIWSC